MRTPQSTHHIKWAAYNCNKEMEFRFETPNKSADWKTSGIIKRKWLGKETTSSRFASTILSDILVFVFMQISCCSRLFRSQIQLVLNGHHDTRCCVAACEWWMETEIWLDGLHKGKETKWGGILQVIICALIYFRFNTSCVPPCGFSCTSLKQ